MSREAFPPRGGVPALFIAGAGTGIGKTYVTAALTHRLRKAGRAVRALKPIASGVPPLDDPDFASSDTALLLGAQGLAVTAETVAACSPWRFAAPLAPDLAAAREGRVVTLTELVDWCEARLAEAAGPFSHPLSHPEVQRSGLEGGLQGSQRDLEGSFEARLRLAPQDEVEGGIGRGARPHAERTAILIEGVGGLMSPVTEDATGLDWLKALRLPVLLVSGSYLGAISHALTAVETLRAHDVPLAAIVVSESEDAPVPPETVAEAIARHAAAPVIVMHRGAPCPEALAALL